MKETGYTPEDAVSRQQSDKEFLEQGARHVQDLEAEGVRLELSDAQMEDAQVVNEMISKQREAESDISVNELILDMQRRPSLYFAFIQEHFGSRAEFKKMVEDWGEIAKVESEDKEEKAA